MKKNLVKILVVTMMLITILSVSVHAVDEPPDPKAIIAPIVETI